MNRDHWLTLYFRSELEPKDAINLIGALLPLAQEPPVLTFHGAPTQVSSQYQWLGQWLPELLETAIAATKLTRPECQLIAKAWAWLDGFGYCHQGRSLLSRDFPRKTQHHTELRQSYFWLKVSEYRAREDDEPRWAFRLLGIHGNGGFVPSKVDANWLLDDIGHRTEANDRMLALQVCFDVYLSEGRPRDIRQRMKSAAADNDELAKLFDTRLQKSRSSRLKDLWLRVVSRLSDSYWWSRRWRKLKHWCASKRDTLWLHRNIRLLASGSAPNLLAGLAQEAQEEADWQHESLTTWAELHRKRGRRIARAVAAGCRTLWETYTPELPHEKDTANAISNQLYAGYAGLSTGIACGEIEPAKFTPDEVRRAVRYAVGEMNTFPSWFSSLVKHHSQIVREVLRDAIVGEWNWPEENLSLGVLQDLCCADEQTRRLVEDDIVDLLEESEPGNAKTLQLVLRCLTDARLEVLQRTSRICSSALDDSDPRAASFRHWIAVECQLDVGRALDRLDRLSPDDREDTELVTAIVADLSGEDRPSIFRNANALSPQHLRHLLLLCHRFIKPEDDIDRTGGHAYTPTMRDYAQRFRDSLFSRIADSESPETLTVLISLRDEPVLRRYMDYIVELIAKRRRSDCALPPWREEDVAEFATEFETDPKSGEELFVIIQRRLTDVKYEVEASDNSRREDLRPGDDEHVMRRWLARQLRDSARERYCIPQEVEIDQEERPDLYAERTGIPPVPIEVKWAERWSYNQLVERLQNQLVGQYLRARDNQFGIYLLGYIDEERRQSWRKDSGDSLVFEDLITDLQETADRLVEGNATIRGLKVIGIDFRQLK